MERKLTDDFILKISFKYLKYDADQYEIYFSAFYTKIIWAGIVCPIFMRFGEQYENSLSTR